MLNSYARLYLMRSLAMKRKNVAKLEERVRAGKCILDACDGKVQSRGLCDKHRQRWYTEFRNQPSQEDRIRFEERSIQLGLILPSGEQQTWTKENPFAKALVS
jgi:hypothetical protein